MELIPIFAFLCLFVASFGGVAALMIWIVKRSGWQAKRLVTIGASLGLSPEGSRRVGGMRGGVHATVRYATEGGGDNKSSWTYTEAEIDPPLRLGLNLRRKGWLGAAWSELFGSDGLTIGHAAFDGSFSVGAIERDEVHRLFDAELLSSLMPAHASLARLWMTDDKVHASMRGFSTDPRQITGYLDTVIHLAIAAQSARRRMGPTAREREVMASWGGLAASAGWRFDPEKLTLEGDAGRHRFSIVPTLDGSGWSTRFRVSYDRPLGVALIVRKEFALAAIGRLFGMRDIQVGETRFDTAFQVKGSDEARVRHILGEQALRDRILHLFGVARSLEIHDDCVDASALGLITDPTGLSQSLAKVVDVAEGLRSRVDAPSGGAYR